MRFGAYRGLRFAAALGGLVLLTACTAPGATFVEAGGASPAAPPTTAAPSPGPPLPTEGVGTYDPGDCLTYEYPSLDTVDCAEPHRYEVMTSQAFGEDAGDAYPPEFDAYGPVCRAAKLVFLGSADAEASRLETFSLTSSEEDWEDGDRWFACLIGEGRDVERANPTVGSLAGALAGGLGEYRKCLVDEPVSEGDTVVVPCGRPHRSEAVGVIVLGEPTDPVPDLNEIAQPSIEKCGDMVSVHLGGQRPDVDPFIAMPRFDGWSGGNTTAVCYAVTDEKVSGTLVN